MLLVASCCDGGDCGRGDGEVALVTATTNYMWLETYALSFPRQEKRLPGCGREKIPEPLARVESQMRTSAPVHPKGSCPLKSKVLSLSKYSI